MPAPQSRSTAPYRLQVVLWLGMAASIGMYFTMLGLVTPQVPADNPLLVNVLLILAVVLVAGSFPLKRLLYARARRTGNPQQRQTGFLVALVLCEAAALFGLVVWFTTGSPHAWWFLILGLAGDLFHFPTRGE